ncbi:MAG: GNAT family N-acetyltransferase [Chloroflexota bacterium]
MAIRTLTPGDLDPLRWVIYRAYYEVLLDLYGADAAQQYEVRSLDFMALYLRRDAEGCFVAETEDGSLAGGLFCFVWGEVGWFGSLAVAPEWQGLGVGQQLTRRAIDYLRSRGCRRIGLETWPKAPRTQHLYSKLGFEPCHPTLKLARALPECGRPRAAPDATDTGSWRVRWVRAGDVAALRRATQDVDAISASVRTVSGSPDARLELSGEIQVAVAGSFAELVVLTTGDGEPRACALAHTRKPSGGAARTLDVRLMLIAPERAEQTSDALLAAVDRRAQELECRSVTCDVNVRFERAVGLVRARGFRPIYELIRMERPAAGIEIGARSDALEFARWAG